MAKPLREFTRFIWWMQTQRRGGCQLSDQANWLRLRVRQKEMAATVHIHHRHFNITQPESWYSFCRPTEGGRMSRPRHCSMGVQPVPKAVYRSGCRDKHNCPWWIRTWARLRILVHINGHIFYTYVCTDSIRTWVQSGTRLHITAVSYTHLTLPTILRV